MEAICFLDHDGISHCWDVSTPEKERAAYRNLFNLFDSLGYYDAVENRDKYIEQIDEIIGYLESAPLPTLEHSPFNLTGDRYDALATLQESREYLNRQYEYVDLFHAARYGDDDAARKFLERRMDNREDYPHEVWDRMTIVDPTTISEDAATNW